MTKIENIECALWVMQRGRMRMAPNCERPRVRAGMETCGHFVGTPQNPVKKPEDVSDKCRRSQEARRLPPIDEVLHHEG